MISICKQKKWVSSCASSLISFFCETVPMLTIMVSIENPRRPAMPVSLQHTTTTCLFRLIGTEHSPERGPVATTAYEAQSFVKHDVSAINLSFSPRPTLPPRLPPKNIIIAIIIIIVKTTVASGAAKSDSGEEHALTAFVSIVSPYLPFSLPIVRRGHRR